MEEERHHRSVRQMSRDLVRDVDVLQPRDSFYRAQASNGVARRRSSEEVAQHPVAPRVSVDEPTADYTSDVEPGLLVGGDRRSKEVDVLDDSVRLDTSKLGESVEDSPCAERVADERDGTDSDVTVEEGVSQDETGGSRTVKSVRPGVVDQVAELGEN